MKQHPTSVTRRRLKSDTAGAPVYAPLSSTPPSVSGDDEGRLELIAAEAYFLAERRNFAPGYELEDWLAAECLVDNRRLEPDKKGAK